jgi:hypothetical protein
MRALVAHAASRDGALSMGGGGIMVRRAAPQTWRLLQLTKGPAIPCPACGQVHRYLMKLATVGGCLPVLFPPGVAVPPHAGQEVDLYLAGSADDAPIPGERSRYHEVAERVRRSSIRCEGCGARFADLEAYRVHACEVVYR